MKIILYHEVYFNQMANLVILISGSPQKNNLENRIFNTACFTACILFCIATLTNVMNGISLVGILSNVVGFSIYAVIYYLGKKSMYKRLILPTCFITMVAMAHFWFIFDGLNGSVPLAALLALVAFISVLESKYHTPISVLVAFTMVGLMVTDYLYPDLSTPFPNKLARYVDVGMVFIICNFLIAVIISLFKKNYEIEKTYVEEKNEALKRTQADLIKAKEVAEKASEAKAEFLSTMSHELRTPMNAVIGISHLLLKNDPKPAQIQNITTLKNSSEHLLRLINDILDFSKIEAGKISFEYVDFNLEEVCSSIYRALEFKAEEKATQLILSIDKKIPKEVNGDVTRLNQILNNLLSNAVKFTDQGEIKTTIELKEKTSDELILAFSVKDSGIGISEEQQRVIFEDFIQANSDTTRKYGGTGLGLAITKKLLELQGSAIQVRSREGEGTEFYFDLRLKKASNKKTNLASGLNLVELVPMKNVHILVAEDDKINILVLQQFLSDWNITFDHAENGKRALEMVQEGMYDLVLMDLQMPVMTGYEATAAIRALDDEKYKNIPIIALTASALLETQHNAFKAGVNDYVSKPFNPNELYSKISKHKQVKEKAK